MQKNRLGRGLDALLPGSEPVVEDSPAENPPTSVHPSLIVPNPNQPRQVFDDEKIDELASSIEASGMLQPLVVRTTATGYELIAGERRLRAARRLGLSEVPIIIHETPDPNSLLLALIENLQREDLNPIEEAAAFAELQEQFHLTQEQVAEKVGRSRPAVANSLRLPVPARPDQGARRRRQAGRRAGPGAPGAQRQVHAAGGGTGGHGQGPFDARYRGPGPAIEQAAAHQVERPVGSRPVEPGRNIAAPSRHPGEAHAPGQRRQGKAGNRVLFTGRPGAHHQHDDGKSLVSCPANI